MARNIREISRSRRPLRNTLPVVYISCEGQTEERYFESIRSELRGKVVIEIKCSKKTDAIGVVQDAKRFFGHKKKKGDALFCIFDKDSNNEEQIKKALEEANKIKAEIIFSNPCFDIWFFYHYLTMSNITKDSLKRELEKDDRLGVNFKSGCKNYEKLKDKTKQAFDSAKHRADTVLREGIDKFSDESNPYTDVYKVIELLFSL